MRLHRFYIEQPLGEELVVVEEELVHQWTAVFRYTSGDEVILFSPTQKGFDYTYRIISADKSKAALSFVSRKENIMPLKHVTLAMALVKKDTFETVVRHATELGITSIMPILADRSEKKNLNYERLHSIAREAAEQSGRGEVPYMLPITSFKEGFAGIKSANHIFTSLHGKPRGEVNLSENAVIWIGPEGGWTEAEEDFAKRAGAQFLFLTPTVLKADTAAVAALSTFLIV